MNDSNPPVTVRVLNTAIIAFDPTTGQLSQLTVTPDRRLVFTPISTPPKHDWEVAIIALPVPPPPQPVTRDGD